MSGVILWTLAGLVAGITAAFVPDIAVRFVHTDTVTERHPTLFRWAARLAPAALAAYAAWVQAPFALGVATLLVAVSLVDLKYHLIPDVLTLPAMLILGVAAYWRVPSGAFWAGGGFALVTFVGPYLLRPGGLGGGDVKLAVVIGLLLGFPTLVWALLIGAVSGAAVLLGLNWGRAATARVVIPYGPFLCLGALLMLPY